MLRAADRKQEMTIKEKTKSLRTNFFSLFQKHPFLFIERLVSEAKHLTVKNVLKKNGACASIIFLCVLIAIKLLFKLWQSLAYAANSLKVIAKFAKSFLSFFFTHQRYQGGLHPVT